MRTRYLALAVLVLAWCGVASAQEKGLAASWQGHEGDGAVLHDISGNGNDGAIHGAVWASGGTALRFNGKDTWVDCGKGESLDITGPITVEAWIRPEAVPKGEAAIVGKYVSSYVLTYYAGACYWYISSGGNKCRTPLTLGAWQHVAGTFDGETMRIYHNGAAVAGMDGHRTSQFKSIGKGGNFMMGCMNPGAPDAQHFQGMLDGVKVYNRALSDAEIAQHFNEGASSKRLVVAEAALVGRFRLSPYLYPDSDRMVFDVDYRGLLPLPTGGELVFELRKAGESAPAKVVRIDPDIKVGHLEIPFKMSDLPRGPYEAAAILKDKGQATVSEKLSLTIPLPDPSVPSPAVKLAGPLPPERGSAKYKVELSERGGFTLEVNGERFPVDSAYSYPGGGDNLLSVSATPEVKNEDSWTVVARKTAEYRYQVSAGGKYYALDRAIELLPGKILIRDTITNRTAEDIGIIMKTGMAAPGADFLACLLAGQSGWGKRDTNHNPTGFIGKDGLGIGMLLVDDVSVSQSAVRRDTNTLELSNNMFGLAGNASHTVEWAVYPMDSGDYFDFINLLRQEFGMVGKTLDGGFTFNEMPQPKRRRAIVPEKQADILHLKYMSVPCMFNIADDPGLEVEGLDLFNYPKEMAAVSETMRLTKAKYPHVKVMFHIAHSLYTTNKPERFADSRLINKNAFATLNDQVVWSNDYTYMLNYFSKERMDEGYRWYVFYPTLENSYGKEMLRTVDIMMDQMGATGVFCDGFMDQYQGKFTYDRWDGHTVEIDPATKRITRKLASVNLLAQDAYIEYCKRIAAKGGDVISDRGPGTLTFLKNAPVASYLIESSDIAGQVHLTGTPQALGCAFPKEQREVSRVAVRHLRVGCLYAHYYGPIKDRNIVTYMYPITVEKIHGGWVEGRERIVTANSGIFGWRGDRDLHFVHFCDARGFMAPHGFVTTVDQAGVRTEVPLRENETAALKKIPMTIQSSAPINLIVPQYDAQGIRLLLNAQGEAKVTVRNGDFAVKPGATYRIKSGEDRKVTAANDGALSFPVALNGQTEIRIQPAGETAAR